MMVKRWVIRLWVLLIFIVWFFVGVGIVLDLWIGVLDICWGFVLEIVLCLFCGCLFCIIFFWGLEIVVSLLLLGGLEVC